MSECVDCLRLKKELEREHKEDLIRRILLDASPAPRKHTCKDSREKDCPVCNFKHYKKELDDLEMLHRTEKETEDREDFEAWKKAGRPRA